MRRRAQWAIAVGCSSLLAWVAIGSITAFGQEHSAASGKVDPPPADYRRIFVPAEKVDAWPRDGEKFLPIEAREFDAWIAATNRMADDRTSPVSISEAEYSARLENGQLTAGRGRWTVVLRDGARAFLPLSQTSLAIKDARWQGSPQRPVRLGTWGSNGKAVTEFGLAVAKSGTLEFAWSAPAKPTHDGLDIPWQLPPATTTRVMLELPEGYTPRIDGGIVLSSTRVSPSTNAGKTLWLWELRCTSSQHTALRIIENQTSKVTTDTNTSLHEDIAYHFTPRGLDVVATWTLTQTTGELPEELAVVVPRELQGISAIADGVELPWHGVDGAKGEESRLVFRIPPTSRQGPLQIVVRASQLLVLDQPWRLPTLRPENVFWTSGDVKLETSEDL
jgi:hypothetical protein